MDNLAIVVEELAFDGAVMVVCSDSTMYRWVREINDYLERNKYEWRVKANRKERLIEVIRCG